MRPVVYDAGVLIAADRSLRRTWAEHRVRLEAGKTRTKDVDDVSVAVLSIRHGADVVSDDAEDIQRLLSVARAKGSVLDV
jgi:predicted nucleic acid-binding protein